MGTFRALRSCCLGRVGASVAAVEIKFWWGKLSLNYRTLCPSVCLASSGSWKTPKKAVVLSITMSSPTTQGVLAGLILLYSERKGKDS